MATVFIGIPTLNRPSLVRETIGSVLAQSFSDYEVVVSDNQSEEEAARSVEAYVAGLRDPRVRFHQQPENGGEYGQGRFFLAAAAGSRYFMILHDDDVLKPSYVEQAVTTLEHHADLALFVANPFAMDETGAISEGRTRDYLRTHGRMGRQEGPFDVLSCHLEHGFTPMSGTLFRTSALQDSGFVDDDCFGNYPFECNVFLRLGEHGARAWFRPEELLGFRFHSESLRVYLNLMENRHVVETMAKLFSRRRFTGRNERRRRIVLSRLRRAQALIALRDGDRTACRIGLWEAIRENPCSPKAWALLPLALIAPGPLGRALPALPEQRSAPRLAVEKR